MKTRFLKFQPLTILFLSLTILTEIYSISTTYAQTTQPLLQPSDLIYQGAFRLPGSSGGSTTAYGGTALAYNPVNDSLFLVGHDHHQMVAEISVPKIINSNQLSDLSTATFLHPFTDATEGKINSVDSGTIKVGGLMVYGNQLIGSVYAYYDGDRSQTHSHFISSLDLSKSGDVQGMFQIGNSKAGLVSGFMTAIPVEWQESLGGIALTGNCCLSIITRTSFGPAAFVFNPNDLGKLDPVPRTPLVYYPSEHRTIGDWANAWNGTNILFNGTTRMRGVIFPPGTRSVLFFGQQGIGPWCYGTGGDCNDPTKSSKGTHAYPYVNQVWAYDALDLSAVKSGLKQPWDLKPYRVWNFNLPFEVADKNKTIRGATYDSATNRVFLSQYRSDGDRPVIHVFTVGTGGSSDTVPPIAPTGLRLE